MEWKSRTRKWSSSKMKAFQQLFWRSSWILSMAETFKSTMKTSLKFLSQRITFKLQLLFNSVATTCKPILFSFDLMSKHIVKSAPLQIGTDWKTYKKLQKARWHQCIRTFARLKSSCPILTLISILALLSRDDLSAPSETFVFKSVMQWIKHKKKERMAVAAFFYRSGSFGAGWHQGCDWRARCRGDAASAWYSHASAWIAFAQQPDFKQL